MWSLCERVTKADKPARAMRLKGPEVDEAEECFGPAFVRASAYSPMS